MSDEKVTYAPFHVINEFMIPEYREEIIRMVLTRLNDLSGQRKSQINRFIKKDVAIPGFRNSTLAPLPLKIKGAVNVFIKNPNFTAQVLSAWSELNPELSEQIFIVLKNRGWEILPVDVDRALLPGFMIEWPAGESYDSVGQEFSEKFADSTAAVNDIRLMIVWLSGRLPYNMDESENA
jgi:hypothetical protein